MEVHSGNLSSCEAGVHANTTVIQESIQQHSPSGRSPRIEAPLANAAQRLDARLESVRIAYDLDRRALLSSQRLVEARHPSPSVEEFTRFVALPMAGRLRTRAVAAIDAAIPELCADVVKTHRLVATEHPQLDQRARRRLLDEALAPVRAVRLDRRPLDDLGRRWQKRLRRAAALESFGTIVCAPARDASRALDAAELALVAETPWAHGDRLLSLFEMAHADVRDHLLAVVDRAASSSPGLTGRGLASAAAC